MGRTYLIVGTVTTLLYAALLSLEPGGTFASLFPLLLPIFAVTGAMGALMVFANDRVKGVLEYLVAYGVTPRRQFSNALVASFVLLTAVLGAALAVGIGTFLASGHTATFGLGEALALYSVPMSYACVAFAVTVGVYWTSLSTPRAGINSPIGLVPIVGFAPPLLTLIAVEGAGKAYFFILGDAVVVVVWTVVVLLVGLVGRLLPTERLLSPM